MLGMIDQSVKSFKEVPLDGSPLSPFNSGNEREENMVTIASFKE